MPLSLWAHRPNTALVASCLLLSFFLALHQLCMGLPNHSSPLIVPECRALVQLATQSSLSTNCNCSSPKLLKLPCEAGRCAPHAQQPFASCTGGDNSVVSELYLRNMSLQGNLKWVANFKHIKHLDVSMNHFSGKLPSAMWSLGEVRYVNLSFNSLSGHIPNFNDSEASAYNSSPLRALDLSHNQIGGTFPQNLCIKFPNLTSLTLRSNHFTGSVNLSLCAALEAFDASFNRLQGSIPSLSGCPQLVDLDVSFNNFSGTFGSENYRLPSNLSKLNVSHNHLEVGLNSRMIRKFGFFSFWPNTACSSCFPVMAPSPSPPMSAGTSPRPSPSPSAHARNRSALPRKKSDFSVGIGEDAILGIIVACIATVILVTVISSIIFHKRRRKMAWPLCPKRPMPPVKHVTELGPFSFEAQSGTWVADVKDPSSVPVVIFEKPLMTLTFADLLQATKSFHRESEVGDGTGLVYKCVLPGVLEDDAEVTIEVVEDGPSISAEAAHAAFTAMGEVKHDNLVPLLGYCIVGEEKLLIYKHMGGGSLEDVLHAVPEEGQALSNASAISTEDWNNIESWPERGDLQACVDLDTTKPSIDWETRHKIGLGVARALAYLHNACRRHVVHGAVSSSCIFLDGSLKEAMVAKYGGGWGLPRRLSPGYVAPETKEGGAAHMAASYSSRRGECVRRSSGDAYAYTTKCDVYGVGVVLLELATGRRAVGNYSTYSTLVAWVQALKKGTREEEAVDPRLPASSHPYLLEMIKVGCLCTADSPSKRPSMQQVVGLLKDLAPLI